jgi:hypothetical protein
VHTRPRARMRSAASPRTRAASRARTSRSS